MKQKTLLTTLMFILQCCVYALTAQATELPTEVHINIDPGNHPNIINTEKKAAIVVTIFGSRNFDVVKVDPLSLNLGVHSFWCPSRVKTTSKDNEPSCEIQDIGSPNKRYFDSLGPSDGYDDLTCDFNNDVAHVREGTQKMNLKGMLRIDGRGNTSPLFGNDYASGPEGVDAILRCCIDCDDSGGCSGCNSDTDNCNGDFLKVCSGDTFCNDCTGCKDPAQS